MATKEESVLNEKTNEELYPAVAMVGIILIVIVLVIYHNIPYYIFAYEYLGKITKRNNNS